ncbi:MAG TPA: sensor histidine kinase [Usitatibacter sp.]|nr:sensor histidine kinase [Usitatibacter sp.]
MRSLLAPLVGGLVVSLALVFAVQWSVMQGEVDSVLRDYIAGELAQDADELSGSLVIGKAGEPSISLAHLDPSFLSPASGRYFEVVVGGSMLRSPSLGDDRLPLARSMPGRRVVAEVAGPRGEALLLSTTGYRIEGREVEIGTAVDLGPIRAQFQTFLTRYTRASLLMLALLVLLQAAIVRFALAPLRRLRADVRRLEEGEVAQLPESVPVEVLPLVREVNRLLELLGERLNRKRESLGNLAHALKAPLTVLTHIADDERIRADPELGPQIAEQLDSLRERIDTELRRARIAGGRAPGASVDLAAEVEALLGTLRKLYRERGLAIEGRIDPGIRFHGDREDLLELCGNLLDNACKWARSRVLVTAHDGAGLEIRVEDDGPGCPAEDLGRIARRGVRLDEATEGHGLGLAIAQSIAASYGGGIRFGRSAALGGFEAVASFPSG